MKLAEPMTMKIAAAPAFARPRSSEKNRDRTINRRHHRVLERTFPPLPGDRVADRLEDHRQVVPEDGADNKEHQQPPAADRLADKRDGQRAGDRVDQECHFPAQVTLGQVEVAFYEGVTGTRFAS
jgi:hypothetical protein